MSLTNLHRIVVQLVARHPVLDTARTYSRWAHRSPAKVILPYEPNSEVSLKKEKIISLDPEKFNKPKESNKEKISATNSAQKETSTQLTNQLSPEKSKEIKQKRDEIMKKRKFYLSQAKVFDDNNEIMYEKLKDNDGWLSSLLVKLKSKKDKMRSGQILVEGWRLIIDGLEAKCPLKYVIFSNTEDLHHLRPFLPKTGVKLYKTSYKEISMWSNVETPPGIFGIFETPTPQTVKRFSKPLPMQIICDQVREPGNLGAILRVAVGSGCEQVLLTKGCVDVWDHKVVRSGAGAHFRLPIYTSLGWEDLPKQLPEHTSVVIADSNAKFDLDVEIPNEGIASKLPVLPYYGVDYASLGHVTLIIGGETEGISEDSYRLAATQNGLRLNIPLQRGVDSLNTGMAAAVIAFEIRKQFIQAFRKAKADKQAVQVT
ncbi:rRNA methyltransferase 3, mitochondrial [Leguminivora glycinivorella]|uniref:rRNA methyltransferase 3, mitochondrial n=1 Tax=Leguminivora glycinivorella TaxID=1035111 RepID=UPI00200D113B|nr:rRNA methyltransferase 3, mitochondrial [Leguminivora glycinivorella]